MIRKEIPMRGILLFIILFLLITGSIFAQTTGKISGVILDKENGDALPAVNIIIDGTYMGAASAHDGSFFILNVPPGTYNLKIQLIGYTTKIIEGVRVSVNRTSFVKIELEGTALDLGEEVVVTASKISIKKDQTSSIRNVSAKDMEILPVESTGGVVAMQPGVVVGHVRGGRSNETVYLIDGISVYNGLTRGSMVGIDPDAVQEVEVITGTFNAKYGEAMSGVVNMVTKEGGKKFHGKLEGYLGNYYTPHDDIFIGLKPGEIARNQDYKFMLHGPVLGNSLTFFVSGRVQDNKNYLNGIRRFNITDEPNYAFFQDSLAFDRNGNYFFNEHTGDDSYVPMDWGKSFNVNGKLTYKLKDLKMSLMYLIDTGQGQGYSHSRKYKPDGRNVGYGESHMLTYQLNHLLSQKAFYELKLSYTNSYGASYLYENPLDPRYVHDKYSANDSYTGFVTGGQDKSHSQTTTEKFLGRIDFTWQVNKRHALSSGFEGTMFRYDVRNYAILNYFRNTSASDYKKTVSYEIGLWQILNDYMDLEVALWYRDIYNLSTVNIVTTYNQIRYGLYGNKDYGNARGLELKFHTEFGRFYSEINYTLQYTRGNADNPAFTFSRAGNSQDPIPTLIPMPWDQRHTLNVTAGYNTAKYGVTATGYFGSGSAYSWSPIDQNPLNRVNLFPNNSKKPFHYNIDLQAHYDIPTNWGVKLRWTVRVYNLLDRMNEYGVNANTGRTNQAIIRPDDRLGHWSDFSTYEERIYSPSNWSAPRLIKLGVGIVF